MTDFNTLRFIARTQRRPPVINIWPPLFGLGKPKAKTIIELRGSSKRAITLIVYELIARMTLPICDNINTCGRGAAVLYVNCDGNFNLGPFKEYIMKILKESEKQRVIIDKLLSTVLDNLNIVNLNSMPLKGDSEMGLDEVILENAEIAVVIIDSIDGYILDPKYIPGKKHPTLENKMAYIKLLIQELSVLTIILRRDVDVSPPLPSVFGDMAAVLVAGDYGENGVRVQYYNEESNHEVLFSEDVMLHS